MTPAHTRYLIRPAIAADLPLLAAVELKASVRFDDLGLHRGLLKNTLAPAILAAAQSQQLLWVACPARAASATEILGFLAAEPLDGKLHVVEVSVVPEAGRNGIGHALMRAAAAAAANRRISHLTLTTFAKVPWNAPLYALWGFAEMDESALGPQLAQRVQQERELGLLDRIAMQWVITHT